MLPNIALTRREIRPAVSYSRAYAAKHASRGLQSEPLSVPRPGFPCAGRYSLADSARLVKPEYKLFKPELSHHSAGRHGTTAEPILQAKAL